MDIENQVSSLEPSKKLRELGVKQESAWYHYEYFDWVMCLPKERTGIEFMDIARRRHKGDEIHSKGWYKYCYSAFTVAESMEALPGTISMTGNFPYFLKIEKIGEINNIKKYRVAYCCMEVNSDDLCCVEDNKLADALAEIRIYLIENELI